GVFQVFPHPAAGVAATAGGSCPVTNIAPGLRAGISGFAPKVAGEISDVRSGQDTWGIRPGAMATRASHENSAPPPRPGRPASDDGPPRFGLRRRLRAPRLPVGADVVGDGGGQPQTSALTLSNLPAAVCTLLAIPSARRRTTARGPPRCEFR